MKKLLFTAMVLCMSIALVACSKNKNPLTGYVKGDVTLGQYTNLTYNPLSTEVSEEEIDAQINSLLSSKAVRTEVTDRNTVEKGDTVNLDYTGYIDGVAFDNGADTGFDLVIGSGRFIPGFEDGLIGAESGSTVDVDVTFPDPYTNNPDLSGKPATFKCVINGIFTYVVPELTEEFIAENTESDSIAAYREYVRTNLTSNKEADAASQKEMALIEAAIANCTFHKDLSEETANSAQSLITNYDSMFQSYYQVDAATYFGVMYGMSEDQFKEYMYNQAETNIKYSYMLSAIADKEKFTASDNEITELAGSMAVDYGFETADELYAQLKSFYGTEGKNIVAEQVRLNKAGDLIVSSAVAQEPVTE